MSLKKTDVWTVHQPLFISILPNDKALSCESSALITHYQLLRLYGRVNIPYVTRLKVTVGKKANASRHDLMFKSNKGEILQGEYIYTVGTIYCNVQQWDYANVELAILWELQYQPWLFLEVHNEGETTPCLKLRVHSDLVRVGAPCVNIRKGHVKRLFNPIIQQADVQNADAGKRRHNIGLTLQKLVLHFFLSHITSSSTRKIY